MECIELSHCCWNQVTIGWGKYYGVYRTVAMLWESGQHRLGILPYLGYWSFSPKKFFFGMCCDVG